MKYLVIVESPSKCKKIEKYLNDNDDLNIYEVVATMGHITCLKSLNNIDMEAGFKCKYDLIESKKKNTDSIKQRIKKVDAVILACDDDREGMGINYSVCQTFNLDVTKTKRIVFNEITETAIVNAVKNPTIINMDVVHAQHARQILDLLVGFKISPMLWKFITKNPDNSLSAGRCQTPALRLIYDNQMEINDVEEKKVYNTTGMFTNMNLLFELNKQFETEDDVTDFLDESSRFTHVFNCSQPIKIYKAPPEPFSTSRIQQVASNELHYSPKDTMRICQTLYEGGFITYMRTDSKTYSKEFIRSATEFITNEYPNGEKYINENIESLTLGNSATSGDEPSKANKSCKSKKSNKSNNSDKSDDNSDSSKKPAPQEAHEAIRPTNINLRELPENIDAKTFGSKERRMYKLIWVTTVESCMKPASYYSITAKISAFNNNTFSYKSEQIDFPGWKIVENKYDSESKEYNYLLKMKTGVDIIYKKLFSKVTIKGSKLHYTEARLVQLLEEKGIGRPSTFSAIVEKIQERGYVKKEDIKGKTLACSDFELEDGEIFEIETKREFGNEKGKLVIQPLGIIVSEFLTKHFGELFDYNYTSLMEESLDKIAKGEVEKWYETCANCNTQIDNLIQALDGKNKIEFDLDENNTYLIGKYGPVIKCVDEKNGKQEITFKPVKKEVDMSKLENGEYKLEDIVDNKKPQNRTYILGKIDDKDVVLKKGRYGVYVTCGDKSKTLKEFGNRPLENITLDEVRKYLDESERFFREINKNTSLRKGPKGDYVFYKTAKMKKPQFYSLISFKTDTKEDYKICDLDILKSWLSEKYEL